MNAAQSGFELFDHTADVGVRVFAPTLDGLIQPAGEGLYAVIGELAAGARAEALAIDFAPPDRPGAALLLRDYLAELLLAFERDHVMVTAAHVAQFDEERLSVSAETALVDEGRSVYYREAKAVTYHELEIRPTDRGFEASFIVDI